MKGKIKISDIFAYIQGKLRYQLYYSKHFKWLIRKHILEQIDWRISQKMDKECYFSGSCKMCGCDTTALQMADKACDKPCYPKMMPKRVWAVYKYVNWINRPMEIEVLGNPFKRNIERCGELILTKEVPPLPGIPSADWPMKEQSLPIHILSIGVVDAEVVTEEKLTREEIYYKIQQGEMKFSDGLILIQKEM